MEIHYTSGSSNREALDSLSFMQMYLLRKRESDLPQFVFGFGFVFLSFSATVKFVLV